MTDKSRNDRDRPDIERDAEASRRTGGYGDDTGFAEDLLAAGRDDGGRRVRDPGTSGSGQARNAPEAGEPSGDPSDDPSGAIADASVRGELGGWSEEPREGMERLGEEGVDERTGRTRSEHDSSKVERGRERDMGRDAH